MTADPPKPPHWRAAVNWLLWSAAFGLAYTQAPLYYSNQNQYFLHGAAAAGRGQLRADWLANTRDPTPLFSAAVSQTLRFGREELFYVYQVLLLGVYFRSMVTIYEALSPSAPGPSARLAFIALLFLTHTGLPRLLSTRWLGLDYPVYLQSGVASQYVLRFGLQPSMAGVFLVAAVAMFLTDRPALAALLVCLGAAIHPTYLLPAALLTIGFLVVLLRERRFRDAVQTGGLALLLALPVAIDSAVRFGPTSPETFADAQRLLARFRIPHHTDPRQFFHLIGGLQVLWFAAALLLVRRHRLFLVVLVAAGLSFALTLVQLVNDNDTLALLFPWRISAILIPIATTIILGRLANRFGNRVPTGVYWLVIAALVAGGAAINAFGWGYRTNDDELPLLNWVKANAALGDVYLIPVNVPKLGAGLRGAAATDFTPPARPSQRNQIAVDLQRFRLYTGVPIYVDFKAVPYRDIEVMEWKRRLDWAQQMYADAAWEAVELRRHGITHVVTTADRPIRAPQFEQVYADESYRVYWVR